MGAKTRHLMPCMEHLYWIFMRWHPYLEDPCLHHPDLTTAMTCLGLTKAYMGLGILDKVNYNETFEEICSIWETSLDFTLDDVVDECCKPDCPNIIPMFRQMKITEAFKNANETKMFLNAYEFEENIENIWMTPYDEFIEDHPGIICHGIAGHRCNCRY